MQKRAVSVGKLVARFRSFRRVMTTLSSFCERAVAHRFKITNRLQLLPCEAVVGSLAFLGRVLLVTPWTRQLPRWVSFRDEQ